MSTLPQVAYLVWAIKILELIFKFKEGCLVCFAMDHDDVLFTTKLNKDETYFMPYNKGVNKRKGNPEVPNNLKTSYMWDEILTKDNILEWLGEYIVLEIKEESKSCYNPMTRSCHLLFCEYICNLISKIDEIEE